MVRECYLVILLFGSCCMFLPVQDCQGEVARGRRMRNVQKKQSLSVSWMMGMGDAHKELKLLDLQSPCPWLLSSSRFYTIYIFLKAVISIALVFCYHSDLCSEVTWGQCDNHSLSTSIASVLFLCGAALGSWNVFPDNIVSLSDLSQLKSAVWHSLRFECRTSITWK